MTDVYQRLAKRLDELPNGALSFVAELNSSSNQFSKWRSAGEIEHESFG